jgi:hypothetical protein
VVLAAVTVINLEVQVVAVVEVMRFTLMIPLFHKQQ